MVAAARVAVVAYVRLSIAANRSAVAVTSARARARRYTGKSNRVTYRPGATCRPRLPRHQRDPRRGRAQRQPHLAGPGQEASPRLLLLGPRHQVPRQSPRHVILLRSP